MLRAPGSSRCRTAQTARRPTISFDAAKQQREVPSGTLLGSVSERPKNRRSDELILISSLPDCPFLLFRIVFLRSGEVKGSLRSRKKQRALDFPGSEENLASVKEWCGLTNAPQKWRKPKCPCVSSTLALSWPRLVASAASPWRLRGGGRSSALPFPPARAGGACGPRLARSPAPSSWLGSRRGPRRWPLPGPGRGGAAARWRCARGARAMRGCSRCPSPSLGLAWAARVRGPALASRAARWCGCAGSGRASAPSRGAALRRLSCLILLLTESPAECSAEGVTPAPPHQLSAPGRFRRVEAWSLSRCACTRRG